MKDLVNYKDIWSKKYNKWLRLCLADKILGYNIYKFSDKYYYNQSKDSFIPSNCIDDYMKIKKELVNKSIKSSYKDQRKFKYENLDGGFDELYKD